ncbi:MAG TPA: flagella basal body P-ring formation protein FlgA [Fimbriimonadaceae bacterium]|nr:flagella basal body P-ring formation protein FlgA [Fimbriimonadaceae bacterium]
MTNLVALAVTLFGAFTPAKVHVDGPGYMRFVRDGRVVYAKKATFIAIDGELGSEGAKVLPSIQIPAGTQSIKIDLQGNVDAGEAHLGRLVLAIFPAGTTSSTTDSFFTFSERPSLTNPGEDTAGVIRLDVDGSPTRAAAPQTVKPNNAVKSSDLLTNHAEPNTAIASKAHAVKGGDERQVEIIVRQHSEVVGNSFSLGDIATITGPEDAVDGYKKVKIGETTLAGFSRKIDPKFVALRLRGAGHLDGTYVLVVPDGADVARKTKTISPEEITAAALKAAQDKVGSKLEFKVSGTVNPIIAEDGDIDLETSDPEQTSKGFLVTVTARRGTAIVGTQTVTLVPSTAAGAVKAGETIKVIFKSGAAIIELEGRALTAGVVGQKINVSVTATTPDGGSKTTTHTGTIIEAGKVEIEL